MSTEEQKEATSQAQEMGKEDAPLEQRIKIAEDVIFEVIDRLEKLSQQFEGLKKSAVTKPKGLFGGKRVPVPIKDLQTGEVYPSMSAVNKVFGPEIGIDPYTDTLGYYKIEKKLRLDDGNPRFVPAPEDEAKEAREKYEAELQAELEKAQAEQEAEGSEAEESGGTQKTTRKKQ